MATFQEATAVKIVDSHTYSAHFHSEWCVGSVPHGGYVTSCFLRVAAEHFRTTLAAQNQPHTITLHSEFLRRTQQGPALFKVRDAKLGRQTSVIHVSLTQDDREEVVSYITNSNMNTEQGLTFETNWSLQPPPPAVDLARLVKGEEKTWAVKPNPFPKFRKVLEQVQMYLPRDGQVMGSLADEWLHMKNDEKFTNASLGLVCDLFPALIEALSITDKESKLYWFPTLLLNLDIKKCLPEEGVDWLFVRVRAKQIKNGRQDLEVVVLDENADIVALSHHVALILPAERNTAERRKNTGSKI
ncbi:uncharacterized protein K452DRAFT_250820 [Aplosporella prunicola CBS 121167]|uniref:Thioesterase domain-containing protein n=1 Tax=Aplosporella prunicola CBS 121167 TaxID=1176127 RepID=A0A6A6BCD5_9PEZI|nr:uncharacterized protein K452DRAFT_250820 [Aplosporella prunicola CBS 121167]KAF2141882.1 hypothetical protein K452DRAFT_250820 [Aplosporella prunicola CBS 121167]